MGVFRRPALKGYVTHEFQRPLDHHMALAGLPRFGGNGAVIGKPSLAAPRYRKTPYSCSDGRARKNAQIEQLPLTGDLQLPAGARHRKRRRCKFCAGSRRSLPFDAAESSQTVKQYARTRGSDQTCRRAVGNARAFLRLPEHRGNKLCQFFANCANFSRAVMLCSARLCVTRSAKCLCFHWNFWCCERGLNSRPLPYQGSALPLSYRSKRECGAFCHIRPAGASDVCSYCARLRRRPSVSHNEVQAG